MCGKGTRGEAHECFKWGVFYSGVGVGVVSEFCKWEEGNPIRLSHIAECSEELLQFLVETFSLTICLRVVCSTEVLVDIKKVAEGSGKVGSKLCPSV